MVSQLVSYIAPSAPATRRPARGDEPFVRPEIGFTPAWYRAALGIDFGERWHRDVAYRRETVLAMRAELRRRFPTAPDPSPAPLDLLTGVFGATSVAQIFGLQPLFADDNWPNVEHRYLSRDAMAALPRPDLDANPFFAELMRQLDEIETIEGAIDGFINWQGIINNAQRLRGQEIFIDLFEAPQACHHLFSTICDTMIEAIRRVEARQRESGVDYRFATVSNCTVNMISPEQYREFLLPYDLRIAQAFDTLGIHNCAWTADPYLDAYATIPNVGYLDMGLHSDLARARALFPDTRRALMYTPMDLANKSAAELRADVERIARDYAPCDIVIADIDAGTPDDRVRLALEVCGESCVHGEICKVDRGLRTRFGTGHEHGTHPNSDAPARHAETPSGGRRPSSGSTHSRDQERVTMWHEETG
jgi:uroporphyrinogen-III decarboxylase